MGLIIWSFNAFWISGLIGTACAIFLNYLVRINDFKKFETRKKREKSDELNRLLAVSIDLVNLLPQQLNKASSLLKQAQHEYHNNAFGPFWDAVEQAVQMMGDFNDKAKEMSLNATKYYNNLKVINHNFPPFYVKPEKLPDPSPVIRELQSTIRMGQTNFQFADIWEQRKTREVMIAGFRTLGEAINNLSITVEDTISDLKNSISSNVAMLVEWIWGRP